MVGFFVRKGLNMIQETHQIPKHIAIIMDGNGRWAKKRWMPRLAGHREGMKRVIDIVRHCSQLGVESLTLYAFSTENWKRPAEEVNGLMNLLVEYVRSQLRELMDENVQVRLLGQEITSRPVVHEAIQEAVEETKQNTGMILNLGLNYGGRAELVHAFEQLRNHEGEITEDDISNALYTGGQADPDLIIRTGGEQRLSNFLLYQCAYAEFYFTDTLWPEFDAAQMDLAIEEYERRNRRFGNV